MRPAWMQESWSFYAIAAWTPDGHVVVGQTSDAVPNGHWTVKLLPDDEERHARLLGTYATEAEALASVSIPDVPDGISPGVRHLVTWLMERGFVTTDSGDGSNHAAGMECALPYANVFMVVADSSRLISETQRLHDILVAEGVEFKDGTADDDVVIECSWNPVDNVAVIALLGLDDATIWGLESTETVTT